MDETKEDREEKPQSFWIVPSEGRRIKFLIGIILVMLLMALSAYLFSTGFSTLVSVFWILLIYSAIPFAMLLVRFLIWERERLRAFRRVLVYWVVALILIIPSLFVGHAIADYKIERQKRSCKPLIESLEEYFIEHGFYPASIEDLKQWGRGKEINLPDACGYHTREDKSSYYITLPGSRWLEVWVYDSMSNIWREG